MRLKDYKLSEDNDNRLYKDSTFYSFFIIYFNT